MRKLLVIFFLINALTATAQKRFESKGFNFSMLEPQGWIWANNDDLKQNLDKLDIAKDDLAKIMKDHKGSLLLQSFFKYDPQTYPGLIPAIQINVREKNNPDFALFKQSIINSARNLQKVYKDYNFIQDVTELKIGGVKSLYFISKFTMKTDSGQEFRVRSRIYVIPMNDYYFQINMTDGLLSDDCSKEFDALIRSVRVKN